MKYDICVFGGCSLDLIYYKNVDGTYKEEPDMKVPGGKGANQAVAAARAGARTTIISRIGKDEIGKNILENLNFNMVDTSNIEMVENLENDFSKIKINIKDKDNEIERFSGAINSFTPDMVDNYADVILNSAVIVCQLKCPKEVTTRLINFCYENNKILILTPCRPEKLSLTEPENIELIEKISLITCNRKECQTIFGTDDIESCIKKYPNKLIVTLGKDGLMYYNGKRVIKMPPIDVEVIDTIGAGDTLNGNLATFLAKGMDLKHALRKAMYASTMKIQVKSSQAGMPLLEDLEEFICIMRNKKFSYNKELNLALKIVKDSYSMVKSNINFTISVKENNTLVTDVDLAIENFLISKIKKMFPSDNFLTEENNPSGTLKDRTWVIDPIDGTAHFIKNSPYWGIQLAFFDKGQTKFSVIYLPKLNEFYYAAEGQGTYLNNNKIFPKFDLPLNESVVEFGGNLFKKLESKKIYFSKLVKNDKTLVANILHINACCTSFCNIVSGKTDALIISSKNLWDIMPGELLCREVGIKPISLDFSESLTLYSKSKNITDLLLNY